MKISLYIIIYNSPAVRLGVLMVVPIYVINGRGGMCIQCCRIYFPWTVFMQLHPKVTAWQVDHASVSTCKSLEKKTVAGEQLSSLSSMVSKHARCHCPCWRQASIAPLQPRWDLGHLSGTPRKWTWSLPWCQTECTGSIHELRSQKLG